MIFFVRVRGAVVSLFSDWIEGIGEHLSLSTPHLCNINTCAIFPSFSLSLSDSGRGRGGMYVHFRSMRHLRGQSPCGWL